MKPLGLLSLFVVAFLVGCHHADDVVVSGADGSQATVSGGGTHIEATDKDGTKSTMTSKDGDLSVKNDKGESLEAGAGKVSEADLGLPFYPGSKENSGGGSMLMDSPKEKDVISARTTSDEPTKVTAFYKDKLTLPTSTNTTSNGSVMAVVSGKLPDGSAASVMVMKDGTKDTTIEITVKHTK